MDQFTPPPFDNPTFSPKPTQPTAGVLGRAVARYALWTGKGMLMIGGVLTVASLVLPPAWSPAHRIAVVTGMMESDEIKAATAAKAEQARLLAQRQAEAAARVQALKDSMQGLIDQSTTGDWMCFASRFFGQGRDTQYPDLRDGLRGGCGISAANRQRMMEQFSRNLDNGSN